jgi:hypothetical protein
LIEVPDGAVVLALSLMGVASILERGGETRIELDRLIEVLDGIPWLEPDRLIVVLKGAVVLALSLMED